MARSLINLSLSRLTYAALVKFAQIIHNGFVTLIAVYATPNPTMANFQTLIDALNNAINAWGPKGARGSRAQHMQLIKAANDVRNALRQLATYAMNTKPDSPDSWVELGFAVKRPKSLPEPLQMVQNFHNFISRLLVGGTIKLKWKRPLATDPNDVKVYIVQYNGTAVQPQIDGTRGIANVIGMTTDTSIIITPPLVGANYFWVTPFNAIGFGKSSEPVFINVPAAV